MTAAPSNEAIAFVEENGMPCNEREFASDLDRFAAQRGAEADWLANLFARVIVEGEGAFTGREWEAALCEAERINRGTPQTGGGDAPHPSDGWTPEIMAEEARRFDEGLPAALDQFEKAMGGGDAGGREDAITDDMNAAHWHGYREGAEAMRERAAQTSDTFTCGGCGMDGKAGAAIRALPIPGSKTDAG